MDIDDDLSSDSESRSRRGVPLEPQTRLCIQNVRDYFMKERDNQGPLISVNKVVDRVAAACKVSKHTVSKICKEIADGKYAHKKKVKKVPKSSQGPPNMLSPMDEKLIELVRQRECLYNTKATGYGDPVMKYNAWLEVANELQSKPEISRRTWDRFRRNYGTVIKKIGINEVRKLPVWTFEHKISFLLPHLRVKNEGLKEHQKSGLLDLTGNTHIEETQRGRDEDLRRDGGMACGAPATFDSFLL